MVLKDWYFSVLSPYRLFSSRIPHLAAGEGIVASSVEVHIGLKSISCGYVVEALIKREKRISIPSQLFRSNKWKLTHDKTERTWARCSDKDGRVC